MRATFLPHNYTRALYQQFQNLRQGTRFVDDYNAEFYQLKARTDLAETEDQLVSRYIGGLREEFKDALNFFDPVTVSEAHQKALELERQFRRRIVGPITFQVVIVVVPTFQPQIAARLHKLLM